MAGRVLRVRVGSGSRPTLILLIKRCYTDWNKFVSNIMVFTLRDQHLCMFFLNFWYRFWSYFQNTILWEKILCFGIFKLLEASKRMSSVRKRTQFYKTYVLQNPNFLAEDTLAPRHRYFENNSFPFFSILKFLWKI